MRGITTKLRSELSSTPLPEGIVAMYLYGSAVRGRLRFDSDIDIAILSSPEMDEEEILEAMSKIEALVGSLLRRHKIMNEVSVMSLRDKYIPFQLLYAVITRGILLSENSQPERMEFENAVKREYFDFAPYLEALRKKNGNIFQKA